MPDKLTLYSKDGMWRVDMKAWKNWAFIYKSIGSEAAVYHKEETNNIWGQKNIDWVGHTAQIFIQNIYTGSLGSGGMGNFTKSATFNASSAELKEWAFGFLTIDIPLGSGDPSLGPQQAILSIDSVEGHISVGIPGVEPLSGVVSASNPIADNSIWG